MAGLPLTRSGIQRTLRHRIPFPSRSPTLQHRTFGSSSAPSSSSFRTAGYTLLVALSAGLFTTYYLDARSAIHRYVFTPVLRYAVDAETGHKLAVKVLRSGLAPRDPIEDDASLRSHVGHVSGHGKSWEMLTCGLLQVFGQDITNPVGLAAGFDKDGEAIDGTHSVPLSLVTLMVHGDQDSLTLVSAGLKLGV